MVQSRLVPLLLSLGLTACSAAPLLKVEEEPALVPDAGLDVLEGTYLIYTDDGAPPDGVTAVLGDGELSPAWLAQLDDDDFGAVWRLTSSADWDTVYTASMQGDTVVDVEPEKASVP